MASLFSGGKFHAENAAGSVPGALLYSYAAGGLTPLATYTNQGGGSSNTNPVVCDADGYAAVWLGSLAYRMILKDASGVTIWDEDNIVAPGSSVVAIVESIDDLKALSKTTNSRASVAGYYAAGDGGGGIYYYDSADSASADNGGSIIVAADGGRWKLVLTGRVSVKQFGATGDGSTSDLTAIQNCYAAYGDAFWPNGTYSLGANTWTPPQMCAIYGESPLGTKITRTGAGSIITLAINNLYLYVDSIYFTGAGNTGISVAATAGPFEGYAISPTIKRCHFAWDMAYGINADLIFGKLEDCQFGLEGSAAQPAPGASTFVALKSVPVGTNYTNVNTARDCKFWGGSTTVAAVQLGQGGSNWRFENCDWEQGGIAVSANDINKLVFENCWFEQNVSASDLILITGSAAVTAKILNCTFQSNTTGASRGLIRHATTVPVKLTVTGCEIAKSGSSYVFYDNATTDRFLPASGDITFYDNLVVGGSGSDKVVTGTEFRGGATSPRWTGVFDSASSGSILSCSDPGLTLTRNGTGDLTLTASHPIGTTTDKVRIVVSGRACITRGSATSTSAVRVTAFAIDGTNAAANDVFMVSVYGV